jgi:Nucleotide modification associated domain 3
VLSWEGSIVNALLVRVGADKSEGGGDWNGPVDLQSREFAYVPIPESPKREFHEGLEKLFNKLEKPVLSQFGVRLPKRLSARSMHLDPDFSHLTYGDMGRRAEQMRSHLREGVGDFVVFYAGLSDASDRKVLNDGKLRLVYAIIGIFEIEKFRLAVDIPPAEWDTNAHSRRVLKPDAKDLVVYAKAGVSGRLKHCLPIGEYRDGAYRVKRDLLAEWGDLTVKDGYLQRSARLPKFRDAPRFLRWFKTQDPVLVQANN